jgi:hypothetical protein
MITIMIGKAGSFKLMDIKISYKNGGDKEIRTPDPLLAKQMLYQLSYIPLKKVQNKNIEVVKYKSKFLFVNFF